jgi:hypothetical protein
MAIGHAKHISYNIFKIICLKLMYNCNKFIIHLIYKLTNFKFIEFDQLWFCSTSLNEIKLLTIVQCFVYPNSLNHFHKYVDLCEMMWYDYFYNNIFCKLISLNLKSIGIYSFLKKIKS